MLCRRVHWLTRGLGWLLEPAGQGAGMRFGVVGGPFVQDVAAIQLEAGVKDHTQQRPVFGIVITRMKDLFSGMLTITRLVEKLPKVGLCKLDSINLTKLSSLVKESLAIIPFGIGIAA